MSARSASAAAAPKAAGYSGTPLARKLGIAVGKETNLVHVFATERAKLEKAIRAAPEKLPPDGMIWASWSKKSSKVPTDITEDTVREIALPLGLVDVKVCAVDDVWSGLKLVIRRESRSTRP